MNKSLSCRKKGGRSFEYMEKLFQDTQLLKDLSRASNARQFHKLGKESKDYRGLR